MHILQCSGHEGEESAVPKFLKSYINLYRTKRFIVKQVVKIVTDESGLSTVVISSDTFIPRNASSDEKYLSLINGSFENINGKRVHTSMSERKYVD